MRFSSCLGCSGLFRPLGPLSLAAATCSILMLLSLAPIFRVDAQSAGAWKPEGPWNGMQIKYSISGANVTSTEEGGPFCCWIRTLNGELPESGTLRVSGSVGMVSGLYANATVTVTAGSESRSWRAVVDSQKNKWADFDVSVVIPPGATSASVSISMSGTYGSAAAGESRGISISASFSRQGTAVTKPTLKPVPTPTGSKPTNLDKAADAIDDQIDSFKNSCFGKTTGFSLGDKNKFRSAVKMDLVIEDNTETAKAFLQKRKTANASTYPSKSAWGEPLPTTMMLPFKIPAASQTKTADDMNREALWHETVHHIEILHGDRDSADNWHAAFRERNGAYLDGVIRQLQMLANVESRMARQEGESDAEWNQRKQALLDGIESMSDEFKELESGAETTKVGLKFDSGDTQKQWPPDLKQLKAWTGIQVSWNDILNHYATGACGDDLKAFALRQLGNATGGQPRFSVDNTSTTGAEIRPEGGSDERVLFSTDNDYGVLNRGTSPIFRLDSTMTITSITTLHFGAAPGSKPGTIGMVDEDEIYYGPWPAQVTGGVWEIKPNLVLKPGRYKILDSDTSTWAQNPQSAGFVVVKGFPSAASERPK
ncbi:hypothetical protein BH10ACI3_BH10ACI3_29140 [soil metagenome]